MTQGEQVILEQLRSTRESLETRIAKLSAQAGAHQRRLTKLEVRVYLVTVTLWGLLRCIGSNAAGAGGDRGHRAAAIDLDAAAPIVQSQ